jgi:enhancing lycopene biosynthesis protein 2
VLSGCGAKDGTETTEAASCLIALTKYKVPFQCFSISKDMAEVVNMNSGELMDEK